MCFTLAMGACTSKPVEHKAVKQHVSVEHMIETVMVVNNSSGIVIYSDMEKAYILTAFHTIEEFYELEEETKKYVYNKELIPINNTEIRILKDTFIVDVSFYPATPVAIDIFNDLAILKIDTKGDYFAAADIADSNPAQGDDIYLVANPNRNNKSISKGVISNMKRISGPLLSWQVDGGAVIFGSSGGGVFNMDRELVGIIRSIEYFYPPDCLELAQEFNMPAYMCARPLPQISFCAPLGEIRAFLTNSGIPELLK